MDKLDVLKMIFGVAAIVAVIGTVIYGNAQYNGEEDNNSAYVSKDTSIDLSDSQKFFDVGEHILSVPIENPGTDNKQYTYYDGYKCIGLGISTHTYYRNTVSYFDSASVLYVNEYPVKCYASGINKNGDYVYSFFGDPIDYEKETTKTTGNFKEFAAGEHILTVPFSYDKENNIQYAYHDGYEIVDIALTSPCYTDSFGVAMYVNTESVKCEATTTDKKTGEKSYCNFGTPIEKGKVKVYSE